MPILSFAKNKISPLFPTIAHILLTIVTTV